MVLLLFLVNNDAEKLKEALVAAVDPKPSPSTKSAELRLNLSNIKSDKDVARFAIPGQKLRNLISKEVA
nr:hypothetical protein Iba_chr07aCG7540 [Ipomoea batatas]